MSGRTLSFANLHCELKNHINRSLAATPTLGQEDVYGNPLDDEEDEDVIGNRQAAPPADVENRSGSGSARQELQVWGRRADRGSTMLLRESIYQRKLKWISDSKFTFESLDLQEVENEVLGEYREKHVGKAKTAWERMNEFFKLWVLLMIIGILTGTCAYGIDEGINFITKAKWDLVGGMMKTDALEPGTIPFFGPYFVFTALNLLCAFVAALFVIFVEPLAAGSGIPEVKCYLNGIRIYRVVRLRTLVAKAVGILFSVSSGLPCGKEGPMIHSGAIIGGGVATGKSSKLHCDTGLYKEFRGDSDKALFVMSGAAAGVGAAFGAPIGGVLFAVEEVASLWNLEMSVKVFICSSFSVLALNIYNDAKDPLTPASGQTDFGVVTGKYEVWELPFCLVLGAFGGLIGALFNSLNMKVTRMRKKVIQGVGWKRLIEVLVINFLVSTVLFLMASRLYDCVRVEEDSGDDIQGIEVSTLRYYGCWHKNETDGYYNNMATMYFSQLEANIRKLFHYKTALSYNSLILHFIPYFLLTVLTYGIAVPSGLFLPCLALGSTFGRIFGQGLHDLTGADLDLGMYAVFGSAAVLSGVVRMTVSLSVIVMEATGNSTLVIPLMIITCTAKVVGDLFNHGIYDEHIMFQKIPLMELHLEDERLKLAKAEDVMNEVDLAILPVRPTVNEVADLLKEKPYHQGFLVTEHGTADEPLKGLILRRYLLILLRQKAWGSAADTLIYEDFQKNAHERELLKPQKYKVSLTSKDLKQKFHLGRYMDTHPYTVLRTAPLPRVYKLFRELGLRHIIVTDDGFHPAGVIARKNLVHLRDATLFEDESPEEVQKQHYQIQRHPSAENFQIRQPSYISVGSHAGQIQDSFNEGLLGANERYDKKPADADIPVVE